MEIQRVRFLLNWLLRPLLQTKNRSRINQVLFLFLAAAWNAASCLNTLNLLTSMGCDLAVFFPFLYIPIVQILLFFLRFFKCGGVFLRQWNKPTSCSTVMLQGPFYPQRHSLLPQGILMSKAPPWV